MVLGARPLAQKNVPDASAPLRTPLPLVPLCLCPPRPPGGTCDSLASRAHEGEGAAQEPAGASGLRTLCIFLSRPGRSLAPHVRHTSEPPAARGAWRTSSSELESPESLATLS